MWPLESLHTSIWVLWGQRKGFKFESKECLVSTHEATFSQVDSGEQYRALLTQVSNLWPCWPFCLKFYWLYFKKYIFICDKTTEWSSKTTCNQYSERDTDRTRTKKLCFSDVACSYGGCTWHISFLHLNSWAN